MDEKQELVKKEDNLPTTDWRSEEGRQLVKSIVAKGCTDLEFKYLFYMADKYNLDPLKKEIWAVKFKSGEVQIYASRTGHLKVAHDSGLFDGIETTVEFEKEPEDSKIQYINRKPKPYSATTTIWKKGCSHAFKETVLFSEYDQKQALWVSKPVTMIRKVSEVQCLRKAFPISGFYDPDEIPQNGADANESKD